MKRGGAIGFHEIKPPPDLDPVGPLKASKCGWCHGSGFAGEKEPVCGSCKGTGWWILNLGPDKRIK